MMEELNSLEASIFERLAIKYPFIKAHIPSLRVASRENTGVGMYINLVYDHPDSKYLHIGEENLAISTNETIQLDGLKYGLCYEVDLTEGKIKFIELVTYGEEWDGTIPNNFTFSK